MSVFEVVARQLSACLYAVPAEAVLEGAERRLCLPAEIADELRVGRSRQRCLSHVFDQRAVEADERVRDDRRLHIPGGEPRFPARLARQTMR